MSGDDGLIIPRVSRAGGSLHVAFEAVGMKHGGGAVVLRDVLNSAIRRPAVQRITVFCSPRSVRTFELPDSEKIVEAPRPYAEASVPGRLHWLTRGIDANVRMLKPDLLVCMGGIGIVSQGLPTVIFIQQSLPFCEEALRKCGFQTRIRMRMIRTLMRRSCREAALIVTQTQTMSGWVRSAFGLPHERVGVVNPWGEGVGLDSEQGGSVDAMLNTPPDLRLLYVGNTSAYKNLECLARALPEVRSHIPGATLFLTCSPDHGLCRAEGVVGLGYLGGSTLRTAYQLATIFVTPSLVESGNLTLVEAMTLGTPIIAADRPYARDLCADAAIYFDPNRPAALAAAIVDLLQDSGKRQKLASRALEVATRGRAGRPYDRMMQAVLEVAGRYRQLLQPAFPI